MSSKAEEALIAPLAFLPHLVRTEVGPIEARLRRLISTPDIYRLRQIVLIGCGDSLIAAGGVATILRAWTGLPVQPMHAMEAARGIDGEPSQGNPRGILAVLISNSGEVARMVEAARRLRQWGALTLALTANPASRLAHAAELVGDTAVPTPMGSAAHGYVATLLGLWLLGIRIAEVRLRGTMGHADTRRRLLAEQADLIEKLLASCAAGCLKVAAGWQAAQIADCLGSGPMLGSAQFAAAKLLENVGIHATAQDVEEFHHLNYFVADPGRVPTTVFTTATAACASRVRELLDTLAKLGRPSLVVTDREVSSASGHHAIQSLILPTTAEWLLPLLHAIPATMLAQAWASMVGAVPFRGHDGPWREARDAGLVRNSAILMRSDMERAES